MEAEMQDITKAAELFEVSLPDYRQLKACRREVSKENDNFIYAKCLTHSREADLKRSKLFRFSAEQLEPIDNVFHNPVNMPARCSG